MKRTEQDEQFGIEFARQLQPIYKRAIDGGETEEAFAKRLGVNRGGLQRYLKKQATPSLRTVVLAFREFGIAIPYADTETIPLISRKARRSRSTSEFQMDLPLTIEAPHGEINVVVKKKSAQRFRLQVHVKKIG